MSDYIVNLSPNGGLIKYDDMDVINIKGLHSRLINMYGAKKDTILDTRAALAARLTELINKMDLRENVMILIGGTKALFDLVCSLLPNRRFLYCP